VTSGEKTADRLRPARCLECKGVINAHSTYTFFCCRECAARWGDDQGPDTSARGSRKTEEGKVEPGMMIDKALVDKLRQTGISV
jgi:hypothetical protein